MTEVKIVGGAYAHRIEGTKNTHVVKSGEVVSVSEKEAERLVSLNVAVIVSSDNESNHFKAVATSREESENDSTTDCATENKSALKTIVEPQTTPTKNTEKKRKTSKTPRLTIEEPV